MAHAQRGTDQKETLSLKVVKKSSSLQSYKSGELTKTYFNIVGANKDRNYILRIYLKHKFDFIKEGMSYRFSDLVKKGDTFWAVSTTSIGCIASLKNVCQVHMDLPENEGPHGAPRSLKDALVSPQKSTIKGKIVQISPVKRRRNGTLIVRSLALKDNSGMAKVCLFENEAEMDFQRQSCISFKNQKNKREFLFVNDGNLNQVVVTEDDHMEDHDFDIEEDNEDGEQLIIEIINEVYTYPCCPNEACRKKKLQKQKCPICNTTTVDGSLGCRIVVEVKAKNGEVTQVSLFNNDVFHLFNLQQEDLTNNEDLLLSLSNNLPITFFAKKSKDRLYQIRKE